MLNTWWFTVLQHLAVAVSIPVLVGYFCSRRTSWGRLFIILVCFLMLWVLWTALLGMQMNPDMALLLASLGVFTFIQAVARLRPLEVRPSTRRNRRPYPRTESSTEDD